jgi:phosphate transport system substrate-binding protein
VNRTKIVLGVFSLLLLAACGPKKPVDKKAYYEVKVAVDETFRPIIEEEAKVFNARFPEADMKFRYLPETDAINLLLKDSVRMIMATRPLTKKETDQIMAVYKLKARWQMVAYDAVALIVNPSNPDTLINVSELRDIMTGKLTRWEQLKGAKQKGKLEVVFDNENSSTVRYIRDSICGGTQLKGNLKSGKNNKDVIKYVSENRNAMGIIGVDWLRNPEDSSQLTFDKKIRVMSVSTSAVPESVNSFQPVQYYIATGDYPLTRSVYLITTDPRSTAMSLNFYYFVSDQDGQLIITKSSQLLPVMPVHIKTVEVEE